MTEELINTTHAELFFRAWEIDEPRANIVIVHGLGEHGARYLELAAFLNEKGFNAYAYDHQGHGKSSGKRGHINSFLEYINDLKQIIEKVSKNNKDIHLLGHSLGAVIGTGFLIRHQNLVKSAIFTSPGYEKKVPPNVLKAIIGKALARILPKLTLWNEIKPEMVCKTQSIVENYSSDPLVHDRVSTKFFASFLEEIDFILKNSHKIHIPVLMLISGSDIIINHQISEKIFNLFSSKNKKYKIYPDAYHELLNEEKEKFEAFEDINEWLNQ